jgi:hypothetical protein
MDLHLKGIATSLLSPHIEVAYHLADIGID